MEIQIDEEQYLGIRDARVLYHPENMFEYNVERLVERNLVTYAAADSARKAIPHRFFLWIPPRPKDMSLTDLMRLVVNDGKPGVNYIGAEPWHDTVAVPEGSYFALNVRDGGELLGVSRADSTADLLRGHRSPSTLFEGIIHAMLYPVTLASHGMSICGSACDSERLLDLSLDRGEAILKAVLHDHGNPYWGVPSCRIRAEMQEN